MDVFKQPLCLADALARDDAHIVGQDDESFFLHKEYWCLKRIIPYLSDELGF